MLTPLTEEGLKLPLLRGFERRPPERCLIFRCSSFDITGLMKGIWNIGRGEKKFVLKLVLGILVTMFSFSFCLNLLNFVK